MTIEWERDHAAYGWRSRAWLEKGEVVAYDDGRWDVWFQGMSESAARGREADADKAKARAVRVHAALVEDVSSERTRLVKLAPRMARILLEYEWEGDASWPCDPATGCAECKRLQPPHKDDCSLGALCNEIREVASTRTSEKAT